MHALPAAEPLSTALQSHLDRVAVDPAIGARWPDYRVLVIVAEGLGAAMADPPGGDGEAPLDRAEAAVRARGAVDWDADPRIAPWLAAFIAFGAKPKRTSPSVLALLRRVEAGLPRIDPITDLYNAVSITHLLPIGGEDFAAYVGPPRLTLATGDEAFDTVAAGQPVNEPPAPGEVVWRDDLGVTCRRWNWRQCVRTRITPATGTALFLLEALGATPDAALLAAGDDLAAGLRDLAPDVRLGTRLVRGATTAE